MTARLDSIISTLQFDTKDRVKAKEKARSDLNDYIESIIGSYDELPPERPEDVPDDVWQKRLEYISIRNSLRLEQRTRAGL